jgi:prevent-host-death family protein
MPSTYSITQGQARFPKVIRQAGTGPVVTITNREETVAYIVGRERMAAIVETIELLSNPAVAGAIAEHRSGGTRFGRIEDIPE